ncbi:MAG TPA: undecaprenyl-diphosphate phosphatase [Vicinamibacteria bacterium]|nr:undecaprenyl-diphosphate phosphatase [Vicinamibacteria bacterium]
MSEETEVMPPARAITLGVLQGLGEFLPISSSGHLIVFPWLLGWPVQHLAFDVALHVGTLAAVVFAFAGDWVKILGSALQGIREGRPLSAPGSRLLMMLAAASVPAAVAGLLLEDWADTTFRSPGLVGVTMAVMGLILFLADRKAPTGERLDQPIDVSWRDALLIGCAQAMALVPGVSRSGATISMALFLGHRREEAARFSFLLATPITLGAALMKVPDLSRGGLGLDVWLGMIAAAVVGLLSIRVLLRYVRTRDYRPFAFYRWAFSALVFAVLLARR